jgi:hypothetical protein
MVSPPRETCALDAWFSEHLVRSFAFHHVSGDRVAIRVGIPYATEVCRGTLHQIGLLLPIPEALRQDLERARTGEAGFLMADREGHGALELSASWEIDLRDLAREP